MADARRTGARPRQRARRMVGRRRSHRRAARRARAGFARRRRRARELDGLSERRRHALADRALGSRPRPRRAADEFAAVCSRRRAADRRRDPETDRHTELAGGRRAPQRRQSIACARVRALKLHDSSPVPFDRLAALVDDAAALASLDLAGVPVELGASTAVDRPRACRRSHRAWPCGGIQRRRVRRSVRAGRPRAADASPPRAFSLARVLDVAADGRVRGTGVLDGDLELSRDAAGSGSSAPRSPRAAPARIRGRTTPEGSAGSTLRPVATALAELWYDRLALVVQPPGNDPIPTLVLHGTRRARAAGARAHDQPSWSAGRS